MVGVTFIFHSDHVVFWLRIEPENNFDVDRCHLFLKVLVAKRPFTSQDPSLIHCLHTSKNDHLE